MDMNDPKYAPAAVIARQNTMIGVTIAMTLVGSLAVGLRVFTRAYVVGNMWADDWVMVAALVCAFGYALEIIVLAKSFHTGFSGADLSMSDMIGITKTTIAIVVTYKMVLTLTKVSILCFYLRIAVRPTFETLAKWTLGVVVVFQIILTFGTIGQCVPIHKAWDLTGTVKGHCIDANTFYHSASIFHILTDVWILLLPANLVLSIPRPFQEKLGLFGIFSLGFITVIAAIFRLQFLHAFTVSPDPFFAIVPIHIWSMVEVHVGLLCASLPTLRPLFSRAQRSRLHAGAHAPEKSTLITSGTIAIGIGATIRGSYRPPVPPKSPSYLRGSAADHHPSPTSTVARSDTSPRDATLNAVFWPSPLFRYAETLGGRDGERDVQRRCERADANANSKSKSGSPKRLALLRRDENGIFRPEAVYSR